MANSPVCQAKGCKNNSTVCDHVYLHNGDPLRFWNGPFQALCASCHNQTKQSLEALSTNRNKREPPKNRLDASGWPIEPERPKGWVSGDELFWPTDLKPSKPELTIVAGAPASGKSTYVNQHARPGDLIVDADREADRLGIDRYTNVWADRVRLMKARNDRLRELATSKASRAWFTALLSKPEQRAHFVKLLRPKEVIVLLPTKQECFRRITASRKGYDIIMRKAAHRWFSQYGPRSNGTVIAMSDAL